MGEESISREGLFLYSLQQIGLNEKTFLFSMW
ncbi:hypothetical protein A0J51_01651 [Gluconobacter japonicus]|nr:hypothetical protein A0J51_01651 [Gluconobacter japonicus]